MKTIINPLDNKRYSVFSKQGKQILKSYVKIFNNQSGGANQQNPTYMPEQDKKKSDDIFISINKDYGIRQFKMIINLTQLVFLVNLVTEQPHLTLSPDVIHNNNLIILMHII